MTWPSNELTGTLLGKSVRRNDAEKFVSGQIAYSADLIPAGALYMAVLRSPHACATILSIDMSAALALPEVIAGLTGQEAAALAKPMPPAMELPGDPSQRGPLQSRCLAVGEAVYAGQPIAAVVAKTPQDAHAAMRLIDVQYEMKIPTLAASEALADGARIVQPGWQSNVMVHDRIRSGDAAQAFAQADYVVDGELTIASSTSAPMETLCYIGDWDFRAERLTLTGTFQNPHTSRWLIAEALDLREAQIRIIAPSIGGTFGLKMAAHPEEVLVGLMSRITRKPVAYVEQRHECLLAGARAQHHRFEIAARRDGKIIAFRDRIVADVGIIAGGHSWAMALVTPAVFPTVYDIANCDIECTLAVTNRAPWQAIRGYGKEIGNLVMERAIDLLSREMAIDPVALRQKNLVAREALPRLLPSGLNVDSGDYPGALHQLRDLFGYDAWRERQKATYHDSDRKIGIGFVFELTPEGGARPGNFPNGYETSTVRMMPSGDVQVSTGVTSPGSGSDTGIAQMVASVLGLQPNQITVIQGDTDITPLGTGNASSRALMYGGTAAYLAAQDVREKVVQCAANLLDCDPADIGLADGMAFRFRNAGARVSLRDIAYGAHVRPFTVAANVQLPMESTRSFMPKNVRVEPDAQGRIATYPTFSYSAHAVAIEVDVATGASHLLDYAVVHDCGTIINPDFVVGQLKGAIVMGIGAALWEELKTDEKGRLVSDRFKSYLLPRAPDLPPIRVGHRVTPNPFHPLGMKGAGESGLGGAMAAVSNAVADALGKDVILRHVPATPPRVLAAVRA